MFWPCLDGTLRFYLFCKTAHPMLWSMCCEISNRAMLTWDKKPSKFKDDSHTKLRQHFSVPAVSSGRDSVPPFPPYSLMTILYKLNGITLYPSNLTVKHIDLLCQASIMCNWHESHRQFLQTENATDKPVTLGHMVINLNK